MKHALDEILVDVVTDADYPEDFTASNVRILLSLVVCLMAPASHFLPAYVEEHTSFDLSKKAIILLCLAVYAVGSIILTAFAYMYEKDAILFPHPGIVWLVFVLPVPQGSPLLSEVLDHALLQGLLLQDPNQPSCKIRVACTSP